MNYLKDLLETFVRLALVTLFTAVLNLLLFYAGWYAWELYKSTHMGEQFARLHPTEHHLLGEVISLTPYWHSSLQLAVAVMLCALGAAVLAQLSGIRRLLYIPFPLALRVLWAVPLAMLLAVPVAQYDARLADWQAYVMLLLPGMLSVLPSAMRAAGSLLPDVTLLVAGLARRR